MEWESVFKVARREDELLSASQAQIKDLYDDLFRQVNSVHSFANSAHGKIEYLEARFEKQENVGLRELLYLKLLVCHVENVGYRNYEIWITRKRRLSGISIA